MANIPVLKLLSCPIEANPSTNEKPLTFTPIVVETRREIKTSKKETGNQIIRMLETSAKKLLMIKAVSCETIEGRNKEEQSFIQKKVYLSGFFSSFSFGG
jgi:hypothetical protein